MLDEETENKLEPARKIQAQGFMDLCHFREFQLHASMGMKKYGKNFVESLGLTLSHAGIEDAIKIMRYWPQICEQHALLYKMFLAKEKAKNES